MGWNVLKDYFIASLKFRVALASAVLVAIVISPLLFTYSNTSLLVNYWTSIEQLIFSLIMLPEAIILFVAAIKESLIFRIFCFVMFLMVMVWACHYIPILGIYRGWVYVAQLMFIFGFLAWLHVNDEKGLEWVYYLKLLSLIGTCVYFFYVYLGADLLEWRRNIKGHPPLYRHLRHMNYDLAFLIGLSAWMIFRGRIAHYLAFPIFFILGFLTLWTGGRGQWVALLALLVLSFMNRSFRANLKKYMVIPFGLFSGGLALVLSGETHILFNSLTRSAADATINRISSGRLSIWSRSIEALDGSWLFGAGPDAFIRLGVMGSNIVQPHNFVVQFLLEFGVIGSLAIFLIFGYLLFKCLKIVIGRSSSLADVVLAALVISIPVFSVFDGLFYHIMPLSMFLMVSAYFFLPFADRNLNCKHL
jgi:O-antigen ligase